MGFDPKDLGKGVNLRADFGSSIPRLWRFRGLYRGNLPDLVYSQSNALGQNCLSSYAQGMLNLGVNALERREVCAR